MAIVSKFKIYSSGKMEAGEFVEDSNVVSLKVNGEAHVSSLDETGNSVKVSSDGDLTAAEFEEV